METVKQCIVGMIFFLRTIFSQTIDPKKHFGTHEILSLGAGAGVGAGVDAGGPLMASGQYLSMLLVVHI